MRLHSLRTLKALNMAFLWDDPLPETFVQDALVDFNCLTPKAMPEIPTNFMVIAYYLHQTSGELTPERIVKLFDGGHTTIETTTGKELTESDIVTWHYLPTQELIDYADKEFMRGQI